MVNSAKVFVQRYLSEECYTLLRYGFLSVFKRKNITCAEELEDLKNAVIRGIQDDEAVKEEKYLLRAGHGGNLDSMATGVLAVGLCDGCKILPHMLSADKRYRVTARLGTATDTYNSKGRVTEKSAYDHVTREMLEKSLREFVGEIWQKPPVYSALKIRGRRASDIASSGGEVNLIPRPVTCYMARCVKFEPPYFTLDVACGQGFYVRSLVHDLGEAVKSNAHVTALLRTKHGPFTIRDCLQPAEYSLENIVSAVQRVRKEHPDLANLLDNYWREHEKNTLIKENERKQRQEENYGGFRKQSKSRLYQKQEIQDKNDEIAFYPYIKNQFKPP